MRRWQDPFPPTPKGFHDRVEQTLRGLEDMDMKQNRRYKKLTLALVAALIALLAIGAVAAVIGNNQLKDELSDAGAKDMAERVQDVHLADAGDGFNFAVDEVAWEGDDLYISYTLSVPEDGNTYLVGLMQPTINGNAVSYRQSRYMDDGFTLVMGMGGEWPATNSFVLPVLADSREIELKDMKLAVNAAFFTTDRPLEYVPDLFDEEGNWNRLDLLIDWKNGWKLFPNADTLYFNSKDENGTPLIQLEYFPEIWGVKEAEDAEASGHVDITYDSQGFNMEGLTPAGLESTGIASLAAERSVSLPLNKDMVSHDLYNGLEENTFRYDDMTITVENFRMTHFKIEAKIWMLPDEGVPENDGEVDFSRFPTLCACVNGKPLLDVAWGGTSTTTNGVIAYSEDYEYDGYVPLGNLEKVELVSCRFDDETGDCLVEDVIADLTPILDTAAAEEEAAALATREAAGSWQPGDPEITVWATKGGTYYHLEEHCSGMFSAVHWDISKAVEAGKKPCPVCAGGEPAPVELEEGEDISCFQDG